MLEIDKIYEVVLTRSVMLNSGWREDIWQGLNHGWFDAGTRGTLHVGKSLSFMTGNLLTGIRQGAISLGDFRLLHPLELLAEVGE